MKARRVKTDESHVARLIDRQRVEFMIRLKEATSGVGLTWKDVAGPDGRPMYITCDGRYIYCALCGSMTGTPHLGSCLVSKTFPDLRHKNRRGS